MSASKIRSLGFQSAVLAAASACAQLMVALVFVMAARGTDPATLGQAVSTIAIGVTLAGLMDFGSNSRIARDIARRNVSYSLIRDQLTTKLVLFSVACLAIGITLAFSFPDSQQWACSILALATLWTQTLQSSLRGLGRAHVIGLVLIIDRVVVLFSFIVATSVGIQPVSALWIALSIGPIISAIYAVVVTPRRLRPRLYNWRPRNPWSRSVNFGTSNVFISLQGLDVTLLNWIAGASAAGLYGAVSKWTQPISIVAGAFASASAPFIARAGNMADAWLSMRRAVWMPISAISLAILMAVFAPRLVPILIGDEYGESGVVLTILALAAIPGVLNQTLFVSLQSLGRDRAAAIVLAAIVVVQLTLIAFFGAAYGAIACAMACLISQLLQLLFFGYIFVNELRFSQRLRGSSKSTRVFTDSAT